MVSFLPLPTTSGLGDAASSAANSAASAAAASAANAAASAENAAENAANSVDPSQLEQEAYQAAASAFFKTDLGKAFKAAIEGAAGGAAAIGALLTGPIASAAATALGATSAGALFGSVVPLLGTAIGAMVGALVGIAETFPPGEHGSWGSGKPVPNAVWNNIGGSKAAQAVADDAVSKIRAKVPPDQWPLLRMWLYSGGSTSVPGDGSIFEELVSKGLGIPPTEATADHLVSIAIAQRAFGDHSHESYQKAVQTAYTAAANDGMDILERVRILMPAYGHIAGETLANNAKGPSPVNFPPARLGSVPVIPRGVTVPRMTPVASPPANSAAGMSFGPAPGALAGMTGLGSFSAPSLTAAQAAAMGIKLVAAGPPVSATNPLLPVAHVIVNNATNGTGATQASAGTTILNATSAAKGPNPTAAQTALADALALAQKIHVHAQYVQKWFGPTEAAKYFNATYITAKDLG